MSELQQIKQAYITWDVPAIVDNPYDRNELEVLKMVVEYVPTLIEQLEQAQAANQKLVDHLKTIKTYTRSTFQNEENKLLRIEEVATEALSEVKRNG